MQRPGLTGALQRTLRTTNIVENLNGSVERYTRNVKRWRGEAWRSDDSTLGGERAGGGGTALPVGPGAYRDVQYLVGALDVLAPPDDVVAEVAVTLAEETGVCHSRSSTANGTTPCNDRRHRAMDAILSNVDGIVQILGLGAIGLGFLLAVLAYRLLTNEQEKKTPSQGILRAIYVYMAFSLALLLIGGYFNIIDICPSTESATSDDLVALNAVFEREYPALVGDRSAILKQDGLLLRNESTTFVVALRAGECHTFLAMALPGRSLEVRRGGEEQGDVTVTSSGINYQQYELCTENRPAEVTLVVSVGDRPSPYVAATYFTSRQMYGADGRSTGLVAMDVTQITPVQPEGFEDNQEFFVHVFSDEANRGYAARALAILNENGFSTRAHIEDGANMAGWLQRGNGIVAGSGEGTQGKAVDIRRLLSPVVSSERLEIYRNEENADLVSMFGRTLAVFMSEE